MTALQDSKNLVEYTIADGIAYLTLNNPKSRNALSIEMVEDLITGLESVFAQRPLGLCIKANGPVFCAGLNLRNIDEVSDGDLLNLLVRIEVMLQMIWTAPCPTIAFAQKAALGAGADILVACQTRVVTEGGTLAFPGIKFGIFLGTRRLAERVGGQVARGILTSGNPVLVKEAASLNLVTEIAAEDNWPTILPSWIARVSDLDPHIRTHVGRVTTSSQCASDMDELVRSASRPGLKSRIQNYINGSSKKR